LQVFSPVCGSLFIFFFFFFQLAWGHIKLLASWDKTKFPEYALLECIKAYCLFAGFPLVFWLLLPTAYLC
jgi:hypothetical protein